MNFRYAAPTMTLLVSAVAWSWAQTTPPVALPNATSPRDVRAFGAAGDGQQDDSAALQRAVDAGAADIIFSPGTYRLTKTVVIDLAKVGFTSLSGSSGARIVMAGPGPAFRFVGTHEGSADPKTMKPGVWQRERMPLIDGISIEGAHEEACGIESSGAVQITFTRVHLRGLLHGIHLVKRNRNVLISACHVYENRGAGVFLDQLNLHQINIAGSHISYNGAGGVVVRGGNVRNLQISGCDIESNMAADGPPAANVLVDVTGGTAGEVAITGCTLQHTHQAAGSANVRFIGRDTSRADDAEKPVRDGKVTIADNVLSDVEVNIELRGARGVTVVGNTFWQGFEHDVLIEDSQQIVLGANVSERNPLYWREEQRALRGGIVLRNCQDCTIQGFQLQGTTASEGAISLENCRRINLDGCTLLPAAGPGVRFKGTSSSRVSDCLIDHATETMPTAIELEGGAANMIVDNFLRAAIVDHAQGTQSRDNFHPPADR